MTDIEKWTFKVKALRAIVYSITLIGCTWKLSIEFQALRTEIAQNTAFLSEQRGINVIVDSRLTKLENNKSPNRNEFDSLRFSMQAIERKIPVFRTRYVTQRRVNGKLYEYQVN